MVKKGQRLAKEWPVVPGGGVPGEAEEVSFVVMGAWQGDSTHFGTSWGLYQDLFKPYPSRTQASCSSSNVG